MSAVARIYHVISTKGDSSLVKATNQAQALRHVARHTFSVKAATALEVAEQMAGGMKVEDATAEPESTTEDKE